MIIKSNKKKMANTFKVKLPKKDGSEHTLQCSKLKKRSKLSLFQKPGNQSREFGCRVEKPTHLSALLKKNIIFVFLVHLITC